MSHRPAATPTTRSLEHSQLLRNALQRQVDHVYQHARYQQWDLMLRSLDRFSQLAEAAVKEDPSLEGYLRETLPHLEEHFGAMRKKLETEQSQMRASRRHLLQVRKLRRTRQQNPALGQHLRIVA